MNILIDQTMIVITVGIFVFAIIAGGARGFIRTFFSTFSVIIALIVATQTGAYVGKVIQCTPVYSMIENNIEIHLEEYSKQKSEKVIEQMDEIEGYPLPNVVKKALMENNNHQIYEALGVSEFNEYVSSYMACLIINVLSFFLVFLIVFLILKCIEGGLNLIGKLPILHGINTLAGFFCGFIHGFVLVWILGLVVAGISWTNIGSVLVDQIESNPVLDLIYNNNLILMALTNMSKMLF